MVVFGLYVTEMTSACSSCVALNFGWASQKGAGVCNVPQLSILCHSYLPLPLTCTILSLFKSLNMRERFREPIYGAKSCEMPVNVSFPGWSRCPWGYIFVFINPSASLSFCVFLYRMTKYDVKNYLENIYEVPVGAVRTRIQFGEYRCFPYRLMYLITKQRRRSATHWLSH